MNATKVNAGPAESNGRLLLGIWRDSLHVTCGLTAYTPGSAPGPTLGNEYGKTLPFYSTLGLLETMCLHYRPVPPLRYCRKLAYPAYIMRFRVGGDRGGISKRSLASKKLESLDSDVWRGLRDLLFLYTAGL